MTGAGAQYAAWGLAVVFGAACLLAVVITDHTEIGRRLRQGARLLADAGPWFVAAVLHPWSLRGRTLTPPRSPRHPAGTALPGQHPVITYRERREFDAIAGKLAPQMPKGAKWPVSGEGR